MSFGNRMGYRSHAGTPLQMIFTGAKGFKRLYVCATCGGKCGVERRTVGRPWCLGRVNQHGSVEIELRQKDRS